MPALLLTVENPAFAGMTLRVPLSEEPTSAWLNVLVMQPKLPGRGQRLSTNAIELHLGHTEKDVKRALRDLGEAISAANAQYAENDVALEQRSPRSATERTSAIDKLNTLCQEWWAERGPSESTPPLPELPSANA